MILALLACTPRSLPLGGDRPDVVLVSIDTLRADHLGSHGYARDTSPFLDRLAAEGARFSQARSPSPWTLPTHTTMLSGVIPLAHGVVDDGRAIPSDLRLVQETFQEGGFTTVGVVTTFFVSRRFGFDRGFDVWEDFELTKKKNNEGIVDAEDAVDVVLESLPAGREAFAFLHLYDVHYPYAAPGDYETLFDRASTDEDLVYKRYDHYLKHPVEAEQMAHQVAQYDEEIRYVDDQLRRLHQAYAEAGREVIFVVTADHGEEFGERGSWGHAHTLHPEQLHVPLIVHGPGVSAAVVDEVVGTHDLPATLAGLAGLEHPGLDLFGDPLPERALLSDTSRFETNKLGYFKGGQRLELDLGRDTKVLYGDLAETEVVPWGGDAEALEAELREALPKTHLAEARVQTEGWTWPAEPELGRPFALVPADADVRGATPLKRESSITLTEAEKRRLEALGYLQ